MNSKNKQDWQIKKLGNEEVFSIDYGTRVVRSRDGGTKYDVYGGGGKTFFMDIFNRKDELVVARFAMSEKCTRFVKGKFFLNDSGLTVNIKNKKEIIQEYLNHYFIFLNDYIYSLGRGSAQRNLDVKKFKEIKISFPKSLTEQKRIVKILDEVFADIEEARENAEKNLENAKELFESYLENIFNNNEKLKNKDEEWEESVLGKMYDVRDGTHDSPVYQNEGHLLITSKNLRGGFNTRNAKFISNNDFEKINERSKVDKGDILFAMIGTIGTPTVIEQKPDFAIKNVALFKVPNVQSNYFLRYYLESPFVIDKMQKEAKGSTQKFVGLGYLRKFPIKLPSLKTQKQIVEKLDELSGEVGEYEAILRSKIVGLDELKKSVLEKAFNGEL